MLDQYANYEQNWHRHDQRDDRVDAELRGQEEADVQIPTTTNSPWAKLTILMTPKISVTPMLTSA